MSAADPTLAIAAYLKAQPAVNEATEGRILRPELPERDAAGMPKATVIVRPAGGGSLYMLNNLRITDSRLDVMCYGSTRLEAENVGREVARALRVLRQSKWEEVKIYWARVSANPASMIDPQTNWPFAMVTTQVMHSLNTIP